MKDQSPFSTPPPIPTPDGNFPQAQPQNTTMTHDDWKTAPSIVRGWAYPLTWLGIVILPLAMLGAGILIKTAGTTGILLLLFFLALFVADVYLNRNFKKGTPAAWIVQIVKSSISIISLPINLLSHGNLIPAMIGFALHTYILSQWLKPEVKAWFGRS